MEKITTMVKETADGHKGYLFDTIVYGPVPSRRLGVSLGVNLAPASRKVCSFNCIYCECGFTDYSARDFVLPSLQEVERELEGVLARSIEQGQRIDVITFAGNGEPTLHPEFPQIIDATIKLRNHLCPDVRIAVLTNATRVTQPKVMDALLRVDDPIVKVDSAIPATIAKIDDPMGVFDLDRALSALSAHPGRFVAQTILLKAKTAALDIDNTTPDEVAALLAAMERMQPQSVQLYTVDRIPASPDVCKVDRATVDRVASAYRAKGFDVQVTA